MSGALEVFGPNIWVVHQRLRFFGMEFGTRMAVVRLRNSNSSLLVYSPVRLDSELGRDLDSLGTVGYVVAPSPLHHLFVQDFSAAYPEARIFACPGLSRRRPDLRIDEVLGDVHGPWYPSMNHLIFRGVVGLPEAVFFHRESATLMVCDLLFNVHKASSSWMWTFGKLNGLFRFGPTRLMRLATRDRSAARSSVDQILSWGVERIVLAHGELIETGGHQALLAAYSWLYRDAPPAA